MKLMTVKREVRILFREKGEVSLKRFLRILEPIPGKNQDCFNRVGDFRGLSAKGAKLVSVAVKRAISLRRGRETSSVAAAVDQG